MSELERSADGVQLLEEPHEDAAFAGAHRHEVDDDDVPRLAVAVDAAHALFQAGGVPRDVVVGHAGAELQVDAFAGGVRGDAEARAVGMPELLHLGFPLAPVHAAVDLRHLADVAEPVEALHQILQGVAVLGEDQPLLLGPLRPLRPVLQHLAELRELRLVAVVEHLPRHAAQPGQRLHFPLADPRRWPATTAPSHLGLEILVGLPDHTFAVVVVRAVFVEIVPAALEAPASAGEFIEGRVAGLQVGGVAFQFLDAPLEGAQQGPGRTRQPPLEHAQRQPSRRRDCRALGGKVSVR